MAAGKNTSRSSSLPEPVAFALDASDVVGYVFCDRGDTSFRVLGKGVAEDCNKRPRRELIGGVTRDDGNGDDGECDRNPLSSHRRRRIGDWCRTSLTTRDVGRRWRGLGGRVLRKKPKPGRRDLGYRKVRALERDCFPVRRLE